MSLLLSESSLSLSLSHSLFQFNLEKNESGGANEVGQCGWLGAGWEGLATAPRTLWLTAAPRRLCPITPSCRLVSEVPPEILLEEYSGRYKRRCCRLVSEKSSQKPSWKSSQISSWRSSQRYKSMCCRLVSRMSSQVYSGRCWRLFGSR